VAGDPGTLGRGRPQGKTTGTTPKRARGRGAFTWIASRSGSGAGVPEVPGRGLAVRAVGATAVAATATVMTGIRTGED